MTALFRICLIIDSVGIGMIVGRFVRYLFPLVFLCIPSVTYSHPAVVAYRGDVLKQICNKNGCYYERVASLYGSAVVIGQINEFRVLLTANHQMNDKEGYVKKFVFLEGSWRRSKLEAYDYNTDLAMLIVKYPGSNKQHPCLRIADRDGNIGTTVTIEGYVPGKQQQLWKQWVGRFRAKTKTRTSPTSPWVDSNDVSVEVPNGVSGGALIRDGKLIGIVSASLESTSGSTVSQMRKIVLNRFRQMPMCGRQVLPPPKPTPPPSKPTEPTEPITKKGPKGDKGDRGPKGEPGDALNADLWDKPVTMIVLDPRGREIDRDTFTLRELATGKRMIIIQFVYKDLEAKIKPGSEDK